MHAPNSWLLVDSLKKKKKKRSFSLFEYEIFIISQDANLNSRDGCTLYRVARVGMWMCVYEWSWLCDRPTIHVRWSRRQVMSRRGLCCAVAVCCTLTRTPMSFSFGQKFLFNTPPISIGPRRVKSKRNDYDCHLWF